MDEKWRKIPEFDGYEISNHGRLRSLKTNKLLKPYKSSVGYYETQLYKNGKFLHVRIHRLVALTFLGPCPPDHCVHHKDKTKDNNHYKNIEYVLIKNHLSDYHNSLSKAEINEIRHLYLNHVDNITELSELIGVNRGTIYRYIEDLVKKYEGNDELLPKRGH
jgi:hypothetical protein